MNRLLLFANIIVFTFSGVASGVAADTDTMSFKEHLEKANQYIKAYRHFEASEELKKATALGGAKHPSLHMRLGILYYGLGLIPEAIHEGERAVELAPSSKWYKYDLAKFYYVNKEYDKAEKQFIRLLKLDPGFTLGYYYLAELYFRQKQFDMAWLSLSRAKLLGHKDQRLTQKLESLSSQPQEPFSQTGTQNQLFRFIKLGSAAEAQEILDEIWNGKLFENLELELKTEQTSKADFGVMVLSELKDSIAKSLATSKPYSPPVIVKTGPDYRIMQPIAPFNPESWQSLVGNQQSVQTASIIAKQQELSPPQEITPPSATREPPLTPSQKKSPEVAANENETTAGLPASELRDGHLYASKLAAFYALENWKQKWAAQDFTDYLKCYSQQFKPAKGFTYESWVASRRKSLSKPKYIDIRIEDTVIEFLSENELLATFKQTYQSNTYGDVVIKTLTLKKEDDGWKILEEREIKKL